MPSTGIGNEESTTLNLVFSCVSESGIRNVFMVPRVLRDPYVTPTILVIFFVLIYEKSDRESFLIMEMSA